MFWIVISFLAGVIIAGCILALIYGSKCKECQEALTEMLRRD